MGSRVFAIAAAVIMLLGCSMLNLAAAEAPQGANEELQKFQGTWVLVSAEMDGKKVHDTHVKHGRITFAGDKVEVITPHQHKEKIIASVVKFDTAKNPREMHWVRSKGPHAGVAVVSIYEFEGPDQYKICFDPASSGAPGKFATKEGSSLIWHTWKRAKK